MGRSYNIVRISDANEKRWLLEVEFGGSSLFIAYDMDHLVCALHSEIRDRVYHHYPAYILVSCNYAMHLICIMCLVFR